MYSNLYQKGLFFCGQCSVIGEKFGPAEKAKARKKGRTSEAQPDVWLLERSPADESSPRSGQFNLLLSADNRVIPNYRW
jgi:hypothetical protein